MQGNMGMQGNMNRMQGNMGGMSNNRGGNMGYNNGATGGANRMEGDNNDLLSLDSQSEDVGIQEDSDSDEIVESDEEIMVSDGSNDHDF